MDVMYLYAEKISCSLISELSANDFLQVEELYISLLASLLYPKVEKAAEVALRELCSALTFLFVPVRRCMTDKSFSCSCFPHKESIVYQWFDRPRSGGTRNPVKAINVEKKVETPWNGNNLFNTVKLSELKLGDDDIFEMFYHGTSRESAEDIIGYGISLKKGKDGMEFSSSHGFYVSKDLFLARERAARRFGENNSAVLVFQVRKVELPGDSNDNGLDLTDIERRREWKELVKIFLSKKPSKKYLRAIRGYDFIEGTMAAKGGYDFPGFPKPKSDPYQLCVRTDSCVSLFDRSLCAVIYFA